MNILFLHTLASNTELFTPIAAKTLVGHNVTSAVQARSQL